ncbi:hypothetical protein IWQ47_001976 [Aquimarina sp. EL_43]|uniref:hypothetical protein n=1 Tax=unclassified Aquimarina TaxID=2627091 RepID=UPI0018CB76A9|nr:MULTISPECIES: hypothetical protein [unclassified Aquimarina]MBG6129941.1 hypothetical protein [Aquimarina sp. EL_35]MBG6148721.1 hypothetical protein [Aquimarina sp. EL_32]MBG6168905.1 hypothetical protein [Aquimarina sp. EL_43]
MFFIPISCHPRLNLGSTFRDGLWIPAEVYAERRRSAGMTRSDYTTTNRIDAFFNDKKHIFNIHPLNLFVILRSYN